MTDIAVFHWSGGKDSMLALHKVMTSKEFDLRYLFTSFSEVFDRVSIHGIRKVLLERQVQLLGLPLYALKLPEMPDMTTYEHEMSRHMIHLRKEGITHSVFGDIFLEDLREYRERQFAALGMEVVFPLWKRDSRDLIMQFIDLGYKTIVVAARDDLQDLCGKIIDHTFIAGLPDGVDPCGENGEFHTFVFDGPLFQSAVEFKTGELVFKSFPVSVNTDPSHIKGYWYLDLIPL